MKSIDKKDMPKLLGLIALACCLFGFAAFQFMSYGGGTSAAAAPGSAANKVAAMKGVAAPGKAVAGAAGTDTPLFDPSTLAAPAGGKDPFLPLAVAGGAQPVPVAEKTAPAAPTAPIVLPNGGLPDGIARALGKPTGPISFDASPNLEGPSGAPGMPSGGAAPVALPPPPPPTYTVTGIVMGEREEGGTHGIAILRGGTAAAGASGTSSGSPSGSGIDRRFVSVGDPVGNGFVVAAVRADGVEIKSGSRRITLKLGSGNNVRAN